MCDREGESEASPLGWHCGRADTGRFGPLGRTPFRRGRARHGNASRCRKGGPEPDARGHDARRVNQQPAGRQVMIPRSGGRLEGSAPRKQGSIRVSGGASPGSVRRHTSNCRSLAKPMSMYCRSRLRSSQTWRNGWFDGLNGLKFPVSGVRLSCHPPVLLLRRCGLADRTARCHDASYSSVFPERWWSG